MPTCVLLLPDSMNMACGTTTLDGVILPTVVVTRDRQQKPTLPGTRDQISIKSDLGITSFVIACLKARRATRIAATRNVLWSWRTCAPFLDTCNGVPLNPTTSRCPLADVVDVFVRIAINDGGWFPIWNNDRALNRAYLGTPGTQIRSASSGPPT